MGKITFEWTEDDRLLFHSAIPGMEEDAVLMDNRDYIHNYSREILRNNTAFMKNLQTYLDGLKLREGFRELIVLLSARILVSAGRDPERAYVVCIGGSELMMFLSQLKQLLHADSEMISFQEAFTENKWKGIEEISFSDAEKLINKPFVSIVLIDLDRYREGFGFTEILSPRMGRSGEFFLYSREGIPEAQLETMFSRMDGEIQMFCLDDGASLITWKPQFTAECGLIPDMERTGKLREALYAVRLRLEEEVEALEKQAKKDVTEAAAVQGQNGAPDAEVKAAAEQAERLLREAAQAEKDFYRDSCYLPTADLEAGNALNVLKERCLEILDLCRETERKQEK